MIKIIAIGKTKEKIYLQEMERYFLRIKKYAKLEYLELPEIKGGGKLSVDKLLELEAAAFEKHIRSNDTVFLFDEKGDHFTSRKWATFLNTQLVKSRGDVLFIIGGAYGFDPAFKSKSQGLVSLSKLTLTHQMVRLLVVEQCYRAFTILNGENYHHD